jgi:hypothetical protein
MQITKKLLNELTYKVMGLDHFLYCLKNNKKLCGLLCIYVPMWFIIRPFFFIAPKILISQKK